MRFITMKTSFPSMRVKLSDDDPHHIVIEIGDAKTTVSLYELLPVLQEMTLAERIAYTTEVARVVHEAMEDDRWMWR